jgi:hypothetical protein
LPKLTVTGARIAQLVQQLPVGWMVQGSNTDRGKRFCLLQNHPAWLWSPPLSG